MPGKYKNKAVITAAVTGSIHTPSMSPHLPVTAEELIDDIMSVHQAGGAVAHLHVRDEQTGLPNADQEVYRKVASEVKKRCDIVLCTTTGGRLGEPVENRVKVVTSLEPELASLNAGSLNFALFHIAGQGRDWKHDWEEKYLRDTEDFIFPNTFYTMRKFVQIMGQHGTKPEFEIYDVGMINNLAQLIRDGHVETPVYLQFVLGILGGIPATIEHLVHLLDTAHRQIDDFQWSVCAAGRFQFPMTTHALLMGGNARVGLEDNLYLERGVLAKNSGEQVAKLIRIAKEFGIEPATPDEAREILGLKGLDKVNY
ncbi:MAG: 3-keto-5-aminohexanoate cleavage protein [Desulfarculaceae bacterium]|nr:3-keto-5-aminohexanoate cleavage protein [Desulfarculaceae bacterium]MCF8070742.1 3-keto-5-aminohexanoate cleavage protein [Desulfarculaceae bacterium]MCF8102179.1 3-keto-5-aminohexanoate cleavage protein [Desulfarculaceae bacterium]MCF8117022.1 3-keto-5-aminohexanoate cleavage protein [Desulfarculaceae bacterium]